MNYRQPESGDTPLLVAARNTERPDAAILLIRRGADVNARNLMGETALFRVSVGANTGMIELLSEHGADVNLRDRLGRTALMAAAGVCEYWNVRALLAHGADPSIRTDRRRSALEPDDALSPDSPNCVVSKQAPVKATAGRELPLPDGKIR